MLVGRRIPKKIELGKNYKVFWSNSVWGRKIMVCKFIQPTKYGFNFLNIETNKCILKHHVYPSKKDEHQSGDWFWLNTYMCVEED